MSWSVCASTNDEKVEKEKRLIDNSLVLKKKTLNAHGAQKEEIAGIIDRRIGVRIREVHFQPGMQKELTQRWTTHGCRWVLDQEQGRSVRRNERAFPPAGESIKGKVKLRERNQHGGQRCRSIDDKAEGAGGEDPEHEP